MSTVQNPGTANAGGVVGQLIGLVTTGAETYLSAKELSVKQAEAKRQEADLVRAASADYLEAIQSANWQTIAKWTALGAVGLVVGVKLVKVIGKSVRGA